MKYHLLTSTRYLVIIPIVCTLIGATTLFIYGGLETIQLVIETITAGSVSSKGAKSLLLAFIELVDLFLLGTVLYIIAAGLYELFINPNLDLPAWLVINDLDDLKNKLIGVVVVVMGVIFLGQVVTWDGTRDLLGFGVSIALVIGALSYFLSTKIKKNVKDPAVDHETAK